MVTYYVRLSKDGESPAIWFKARSQKAVASTVETVFKAACNAGIELFASPRIYRDKLYPDLWVTSVLVKGRTTRGKVKPPDKEKGTVRLSSPNKHPCTTTLEKGCLELGKLLTILANLPIPDIYLTMNGIDGVIDNILQTLQVEYPSLISKKVLHLREKGVHGVSEGRGEEFFIRWSSHQMKKKGPSPDRLESVHSALQNLGISLSGVDQP